MAQTWLRDCCQNHKNCEQSFTELDFVPSRLIELSNVGTGRWKLVTNDMISASAVDCIALSYCWGTTQTLLLTKTSMPGFLERLLISVLPRTFRDTVVVAQHLGIKYVWIDALCIIQDSKDGWLNEFLTMADVYGNLILTVAAAAAENVNGGLFRARNSISIQPMVIYHEIGIFRLQRSNYWQSRTSATPLARRGWTLQESRLAKRVLHFSEDQVLYECRSHSRCEGFPTGGDLLGRRLIGLSPRNDLPQSGSKDLNGHYVAIKETWRTMISEYQGCVFNHPSDRLIAFAGITDAAERLTGDRCVAGLWQSRLLQELCWHVRGIDWGRTNEARVPSWSWLSMKGEIKLDERMEYVFQEPEASNRDRPPLSLLFVDNTAGTPLATVLHCLAKIEKDFTGETSIAGSLRLRGCTTKGALHTVVEDEAGASIVSWRYGFQDGQNHGPLYLFKGKRYDCQAFPDTTALPSKLFALPFFAKYGEYHGHAMLSVKGLVLAKHPSLDGAFIRVGMFRDATQARKIPLLRISVHGQENVITIDGRLKDISIV